MALVIGVAAVPSAGGAVVPVVNPTQTLAALDRSHGVFARPGASGATLRVVLDSSRPVTGGQTVLPVVGRATVPGGAHWLRVMLPGRPNGSTGWIAQPGTTLRTTSWRLVVTTEGRRVRVYRRGRLVRTFAAIVGKAATPTPHGEFFVEESVLMAPGSAGAPFALALSARSDALRAFDGGVGQIALHGVAGLSGALGTAVSHGCVRLGSGSMRWLAAHIVPGVPVTITD